MRKQTENFVHLVGYLTKDPEVNTTDKGAAGNVTIATNHSRFDKEKEEYIEMTDFNRVVFYNKDAEFLRDNVKKGDRLIITGRLTTRKWQTPQGEDRYTTEVVAETFIAERNHQSKQTPPQSGTPAEVKTPTPAPEKAPLKKSNEFDDFDDDIPF